MKILLLFLIPVIATAILGVLYFVFEDYILELLSTWPKKTTPKNILRITLGLSSLLILSLSYWIIVLKEKQTRIEQINKKLASDPENPLVVDRLSKLLVDFHDLNKNSKDEITAIKQTNNAEIKKAVIQAIDIYQQKVDELLHENSPYSSLYEAYKKNTKQNYK